MTVHKVVIIGSGLIGSQWAQLYASGGHHVMLYDSIAGQAERCCDRIRAELQRLSSAGQLRGNLTVDEQVRLISAANDLQDALSDATIVQECVFEQLQIKRQVFKELDNLAPASTILCSSSSCLTASQFTADLLNRQRCLIAHPVNPPYHVLLVELVPAPYTDPEAVSTIQSVLKSLGQQPVVLHKEVDGFAVNRLQYAVINEAWRLVTSGVMSAEDVDKVMLHGLGPRYCYLGPLAVMHTNANGVNDYCQRYGSGLVRVSATFGATPSYEGDEVETVAKQMEALMPTNKLPQVRERRDEFLAEMAKLRRKFPELCN